MEEYPAREERYMRLLDLALREVSYNLTFKSHIIPPYNEEVKRDLIKLISDGAFEDALYIILNRISYQNCPAKGALRRLVKEF